MMNEPKPDEIEISLFGPGYGECVVIHPGDGQWIVVDSCVDPELKVPVALKYFASLGVNPEQAVKLIIASHWHDDHVRGLGRLLQACPSAEFACSEALDCDEFFEVVYAQTSRFLALKIESGVNEFRQVFDELGRRARVTHTRPTPPLLAVAERCLWQKDIQSVGAACTIHALSPSDAALMVSKLDIARLLPKAKEPKKGIWPSGKNHAGVALWVSIGDRAVLLGADLEETGEEHTGWQVVVESTRRPRGKASVFKVPHHGSLTGYNNSVWTEMLSLNPIAVLSPYRLGGSVLPTAGGIAKICEHTQAAFITNKNLNRTRSVKRDRAVEKTLRELGLSPRKVDVGIGHIRLRARPTEDWQVALFDEAGTLCEIT